jgi:WD40 repeat protein
VRASESANPHVEAEGNYSLALRPDGAILALGDRTGNVALFDTNERRWRGAIGPIADETGGFSPALAFSSDGRTLAIGSQVGNIALYSVASPDRPRLRLRLPGHHGRVSGLVFDEPGDRLASASWADPLVEVWDLTLIGHELARLGLTE